MDSSTERLLCCEKDAISVEEQQYTRARSRSKTRVERFPWLVVFLSLIINVLLATLLLLQRRDRSDLEPSKYAGLLRNVPIGWDPYSGYGTGNKNETDRSIMWESLDVSLGEVSLDKEWARRHGLPPSQRFPWDHSRELFLLNGHHSLHCLRKIRRWVTISHHNGTQLDGYPHLVHCMDHLLQNILCEADDTPMYTTQTKAKDAGLHQSRMCRSWDKLNEWAAKQTSCYAYINETQGVDTTFNRYKWCPKGHDDYAAKMRARMGLPDGWREERPAEIESMPPYWEDFVDNVFVFKEATEI